MKLALRLITMAAVITSAVGAFQVLVIISFVKFTVNPSPTEISIILHSGLPVIFFLLGVFFITVVAVGWPLVRFLIQVSRGEKLSDPEILKVQTRIVNFGYQIALISLFFYLVAYPLIAVLWCFIHLNWGIDKLLYVALAGIIAGIVNLPLSIYATNLITPPLMAETFRQSPTLPQSSRLGYPVNLRIKLVFAFFSLILSTLIYTSVVGYTQSRQILDTAQSLEVELHRFDQCQQCHNFQTMEAQRDKLQDPKQVDRLRSGHTLPLDQNSIALLNARMSNLRIFFIVIVLVASALALLLSYLASSDLNLPIRQIVARAHQLAEGRTMDAEIQLVSTDEFAVLARAFNEMVQRIRSQFEQVTRLADNIRQAIRQLESSSNLILSVSTEQSSGATEQAASVAQASAIAQEIVVTAKQIAEHAGRVDQVSQGTLQACDEGKQKLRSAVGGFDNIRNQMNTITTAMERLEDRFQEMDKITGMIEDVAEQTELLALNAALEAAGAGDQGRRFGVVAQATRRLAMRATEATVEIRDLLGSIRDATLKAIQMAERGNATVQSGQTLIDGVAQAIEQISLQARDTSTAVREITLSTQQQTSASEQMAHAIGEVNEVAKQVADGAKEIEHIFSDLTKFTESLRHMVGK